MPTIPWPEPPLAAGDIMLRRWQETDVPVAHALTQDPDVSRFTRIPDRQSEGELRRFFRSIEPERSAGRSFSLAIASATSGEAFGGIGMSSIHWSDRRAEVGYWVGRSHRGRGVATAAVRLLSGWVIETLGMERLELHIDPDNSPSITVAERAGYVREGVLRSYELRKGRRVDVAMYALLARA
jgi:[ribosomal protein S5]-alanine N-acetyltransferase